MIVSTVGGPAELMLDGVTGLQIGGRDAGELCDAMERMMDPDFRDRLGRQARAFTESRRVDEPFTSIFDSDGYRRRLKARTDLHSDVFELGLAPFVDAPSFGEAKIVA